MTEGMVVLGFEIDCRISGDGSGVVEEGIADTCEARGCDYIQGCGWRGDGRQVLWFIVAWRAYQAFRSRLSGYTIKAQLLIAYLTIQCIYPGAISKNCELISEHLSAYIYLYHPTPYNTTYIPIIFLLLFTKDEAVGCHYRNHNTGQIQCVDTLNSFRLRPRNPIIHQT